MFLTEIRQVDPAAPVAQPVACKVVNPAPVSPPADDRWLLLANAVQALAAVVASLAPGAAAASNPLTLSHSPAPAGMTLTELVNEFLKTKARSGRSDRYLRQVRVSLSSFANGRGRMFLKEINAADVERWLEAQNWSKKTSENYLKDVRTLFNFAIKRGLSSFNPAAGAEPINNGQAEHAIGVHSPAEVARVLAAARKTDLDICRHLAIRYFAGIRSAEAHRLRESDLKLEMGLIEVPAVKSKTRSRRLVTIQPALAAWLAVGGSLRPIGPMQVRAAIRDSKVEWVHNACRHSFISYHLAAFENPGKTSLEAGTAEANIFRHYRALVTPSAAAEFWAIRPG